jgi:hypothetical protein
MDNKEKKSKKFEKMAEMMRNCCPREGDMADCCSMMKKMMQYCEGKEEASQNSECGVPNTDCGTNK